MLKRLLIISVAASSYLSCVTLQESKPKLTWEERLDSAKVWYSVGKDDLVKALDGRGSYETAISELKKAYGYTLAKDTTGALDSLRKNISLDLAYAFLKNKQIDSSEFYYNKVIEIDSTDPRGWQGLGFIYGIIKGDYEKSEKYYKKALEVSPDNSDVLFGLAKVYEKAGKDEEAEKLYAEALERKPDDPALNVSYGKFLIEKKNYSKAIPYLEKAYAKKKEDKKILEDLVEAYTEAAKDDPSVDLSKALSYVTSLIKLADTTEKYKYYMQRAKIYEKLKKTKEAIADYEKVLELNPSAKIIKVRLAYLYDDIKDEAKAEKLAREVASDKEIDPQYRGAAWALLGDIRQRRAERLFRRKEYQQAVASFDSAKAAYQQAALLGNETVKSYAQRQLERVEQLRLKAWRKWKRID